MKKLLIGLLLVLLPAIASAQDITGTTCTQTVQTGCLVIPVQNQASIGIQITGTWSGTITFKGSVDGLIANATAMLVSPLGSTTAVSTTTSNGVWKANVSGLRSVIVQFTSGGTGTATVLRITTQLASGSSGATSGGGGGGVTSVAATVPTGLSVSGSPITTTGTLAISLSGSPTVDDTSGGTSCGTSGNPSMVSGSVDLAWSFNVGAGGGTDCTITFSGTAPNRWVCTVTNETNGNLVRATGGNTTTIKVQGVLTASDVISGVCFAR